MPNNLHLLKIARQSHTHQQGKCMYGMMNLIFSVIMEGIIENKNSSQSVQQWSFMPGETTGFFSFFL